MSIKRDEQFVDRAALSQGELIALIAARRASGLQAKAVAKRIGVGWTTFDNWEAGRRRPPKAALAVWCGILLATTKRL